MKPAMSAEKTKYAMSLQRSASAPETMVTEEDANATASRNRSIAPGAWSAPRSRKNCTHGHTVQTKNDRILGLTGSRANLCWLPNSAGANQCWCQSVLVPISAKQCRCQSVLVAKQYRCYGSWDGSRANLCWLPSSTGASSRTATAAGMAENRATPRCRKTRCQHQRGQSL